MILEGLEISMRNTWEGPPGYRGRIKFKNERGTVEIALNDETSRKLLAVVAEQAVESARDIANNLAADVFTHPALEAPATV